MNRGFIHIAHMFVIVYYDKTHQRYIVNNNIINITSFILKGYTPVISVSIPVSFPEVLYPL